MTEAISAKSTKTEILDAYQQALKELKELKKTSRKEVQEEIKKKEVVETASHHTPEKLIKSIADTKLELNQYLNLISEHMNQAHQQLMELNQAIAIETETLQERHEINAQADALEALLLAQERTRAEFDEMMREQRQRFEIEMQEKRSQWKKEQEIAEQKRKEEEMSLQLTRQREAEAYDYQLKLTRQKAADSYAQTQAALEQELHNKRLAFDKEFAEREAHIKASETELENLRTQVQAFPQQLSQATTEAENRLRQNLESHYQFQIELKAKETEGELKLNRQMIASLENKIKEQEALIEQLTQKANQASQQVQQIALKALESSSVNRMVLEKPMEIERSKS